MHFNRQGQLHLDSWWRKVISLWMLRWTRLIERRGGWKGSRFMTLVIVLCMISQSTLVADGLKCGCFSKIGAINESRGIQENTLGGGLPATTYLFIILSKGDCGTVDAQHTQQIPLIALKDSELVCQACQG